MKFGFTYRDLTFLESAADSKEIENPAAKAAGFHRHTWNANGSRLQLKLFIIPGRWPFVKPSFLSAPAPRGRLGGHRFGASALPEPEPGAFHRIPRALMADFRFLAWTRLFLDSLGEGGRSLSCRLCLVGAIRGRLSSRSGRLSLFLAASFFSSHGE